MATFAEQLNLRFKNCALGLSARRLWDHTEYRQINPFSAITQSSALNPQAYVDVIDLSWPWQRLTGLTLEDVFAGKTAGIQEERIALLVQQIDSLDVHRWLNGIREHLRHVSEQRAMRNLPAPFLPADNGNPLGVQGLHCALPAWLEDHRMDKAGAQQWLHRVNNLTGKGLRIDEINFSRFVVVKSFWPPRYGHSSTAVQPR